MFAYTPDSYRDSIYNLEEILVQFKSLSGIWILYLFSADQVVREEEQCLPEYKQ